MLSDTPWLALFLSLIGHSKQLKQLCTYLIGWGLYSCLSWLGVAHKYETKFGLVWSWTTLLEGCSSHCTVVLHTVLSFNTLHNTNVWVTFLVFGFNFWGKQDEFLKTDKFGQTSYTLFRRWREFQKHQQAIWIRSTCKQTKNLNKSHWAYTFSVCFQALILFFSKITAKTQKRTQTFGIV